MKKNTMMRIASVLLVAVLLSTSVISGTYAKYVTEGTATETARVAKWGVEVEAELGLFATDYETDETGDPKYSGTYTVSSAAGDRDEVLAPGTEGSLANISISGTPEVATRVSFESTVTLSDNWNVTVDGASKFYCPVTITVGTGDGAAVCGLNYSSADDFAEAIKGKIDAYSADYAPNTDLSNLGDKAPQISWKWAFENATGSAMNQTNEYDTDLGDAAVNSDLKITVEMDITVSQID